MNLGARGARAAVACGAIWLLIATAALPAMAQETVDVPPVTASSVFAFDPETGEVILAQDEDSRSPIGSVTKVMTALVVMDRADLDEEVTILESDMVGPGYSSMGLQPGDTLTVEQLLTGMMVVSGGDAAKALARHVGSDLADTDGAAEAIAAFVEAMNDKAEDLQLDDTRFANPDGEDDDQAWSTARDVAVMFAFLMTDPTLALMAGLSSYEIISTGPEATPYSGLSTNQLAGVDGVTGAKTGSTLDAGGCLVLAREGSAGVTEIIAILGSDLEYDETWTATVDERWTDAQIVMEAIDSHWTPGQNQQVPESTEAPEPTWAQVLDTTDGTSAPQPALANARSEGSGAVTTATLLPAIVATGVIAIAGILAWSRIVPRTGSDDSTTGGNGWS